MLDAQSWLDTWLSQGKIEDSFWIKEYSGFEEFQSSSRKKIWPQMAVAHTSFSGATLTVLHSGKLLWYKTMLRLLCKKLALKRGREQGNSPGDEGIRGGRGYMCRSCCSIAWQWVSGSKLTGQQYLGVFIASGLSYLWLADIRHSVSGYVLLILGCL